MLSAVLLAIFSTRTLILIGGLSWYSNLKTRAIKWHRERLKMLDFKFLIEEYGKELVIKRREYLDNGGSVMDKGYPDLFDIVSFPDPGLLREDTK